MRDLVDRAKQLGMPALALSSVVIPQERGLYGQLLPEFERRTGNRVEVTTAVDVYGPAREGKFDIVLSHYQHEGVRYLAEVISRAAGLETNPGWYVDKATRGPEAMRAAAQSGAYTMWGLVPFLRFKQQSGLPLEPLVTQDQLLRSVMVTVVVAPKAGTTNVEGARSLQKFLMEAETQAKIRMFRMAGVAEQVWWPAAHDNEKGLLGNWP